VEDAVTRMMGPDPEDRFWYLTLYNETFPMPALTEGPAGDQVRQGVVRGLYQFAGPAEVPSPRATASLCFSGPMWQVAMEARRLLAEGWGIAADTWSATSWSTVRQDAVSVERWNRLHPAGPPRVPYVTEQLGGGRGPVVAVSDYMRAVPDQIARWVPRPFTSLGTDGFGRSDAREALRRYFEVDAAHVVVAVLSALAAEGSVDRSEVATAIQRFGIDPDAAEPFRA